MMLRLRAACKYSRAVASGRDDDGKDAGEPPRCGFRAARPPETFDWGFSPHLLIYLLTLLYGLHY